MGQDLPVGRSEKPRIVLPGLNQENLRRRDLKTTSRELLKPLFGQVAVATVRNVLYSGVSKLQNVDKMLADKVAQLRARKEQQRLQQTVQNEDDSATGGCSLEPEDHDKADVSSILQNEQLKHLKDE